MPRIFAVLLSVTIGMLPLAMRADGPGVSATHVRIRAATPTADAMIGYLVLENLSDQTLTLAAVSSPDFGSVVIHRSASPANDDRIQPVSNLSIPAHKSLIFASDNYYLLLTKPVKRIYDGDLVTLTLAFSDHSSLTIMAPVRHDQPGN